MGEEWDYANLEEELTAMTRMAGSSALLSESEGSSDEDDDDDVPAQLPVHSNTTYIFGASVRDVFTSKGPKRIRRGKTAGKLLPDYILEPLTEAQDAFASKDYTKATALLSSCAKLAPRLPDTYLTMAMMHEEVGNLHEATQLYLMAAINSSNRAVSIWQKVIDLSLLVGEAQQALLAANRIIIRKPRPELFVSKMLIELEHLKDERKVSPLNKKPCHCHTQCSLAGNQVACQDT